jgi:hypothetical protein
VGTGWLASFAVIGYPREVGAGWLAPLLAYPGRLDVALHIEPIDPAAAVARLRTQLAKLESGRRHTAEHGRLHDPAVEAATEDAYDLSARLARGEGKLFRLGLYLTVLADSETQLVDDVAAVRSLAASLLLDARPTTWRALHGWTSTLPLGLDPIRMRRSFDTEALAAAFPFTSPDLPAPNPVTAAVPAGVLYGYNLGSAGLVCWDRFAPHLHNHNSVILARSGAGKSYLAKLELLRNLHRGVHAAVIDPEDEYTRLAHAVGGRVLHLGRDGVRLNPFDLPRHPDPHVHPTARQDMVARRSLFLHTALAVLLGELSPIERAVLDRAILAAYQHAGIHPADPRTWRRPAPTLRTLRDLLTHPASLTHPAHPAHPAPLPMERTGPGPGAADTFAPAPGLPPDVVAQVGGGLAARLHPFIDGAFNGLFDGPTTTPPGGHLMVFSLRELAEELKPIATLLTLDTIWSTITDPALRRPRLVMVDEAWLLMRQPAGADFLARLAKSARKHWAGLTVATQDTTDLLDNPLGRAVVTNAATQILLRQAPQAIDEITTVFGLSGGERQFLLAADRGQGLLCTGTHRVAFQAIASPVEDELVTSSPAQLAHSPIDTGHILLRHDRDFGHDDGEEYGAGYGSELGELGSEFADGIATDRAGGRGWAW